MYQEGQASLGSGLTFQAGWFENLAIRNTPYENEKIGQLQLSCPKLKIALEKPHKYELTGSRGVDGSLVIKIASYGLSEAIRLYRSEYFRLDAAGMLPAKQKAGHA